MAAHAVSSAIMPILASDNDSVIDEEVVASAEAAPIPD
jgi:hypothetical protein